MSRKKEGIFQILGEGKHWSEGVDDENFYIQQVDLNGKSGYYLSHDDLLKGGKLSFRMGNSPKY